MEDNKQKNMIPSEEKNEQPSLEFRSMEMSKDIILIPQPSDDPRDPLNWPFRKKATIFAVLFLAYLAGSSAPFCGQLNLKPQAALYGKTVTQMTYATSAASAGFFTGGFFWWPLSHVYGRSSIIFWGQLGCLATQIWAPLMTSSNQYVAYILSRFLSAFFGIMLAILGPLYLVELFFLHQRGRAFTIFLAALNIGIAISPTFSGFVAQNGNWTLEFWWSVGLLGVTSILTFCFLEETGFDREDIESNPVISELWVRNRIQTFFPGTKVVKPTSLKKLVHTIILPFQIAISPVVLLAGAFNCISFGFYIGLNAFTPVWLQTPKKLGGYGFTITENAEYSFIHWISLVFSVAYGQYFTDRIPMWLTRRNGGIWKPEYRLHVLWIPCFVLTPIGFGLVGASLQYKLHWIVLAIGSIFITIGSQVSPGVSVNYVCECFRNHTTAASLPINAIRLILSICINFFITDWVAAVDVGWAYGMMALFQLLSFGFLILLIWKGHVIRSWTPFGLGSSEEGDEVVRENRND